MEKHLRDNIDIRLPVKVKFKILEQLLRDRMVGENIQVEKENGDVTRYARILDVSLERSREEDYDLTVELRFTTLTTLFRNQIGGLLFHARVDFHEQEQKISVGDYKIKGTGDSWFMNKTLETVANSIMYNKLKKKMNLDFRPHMEPQLKKLNTKLQDKIEITQGIFLAGNLSQTRICDLIIGNSEILVLLHIQGGTGIEVSHLDL